MDSEILTESIDRHPLVSLASACFWVVLWLLSWAKSLIGFVTITIPWFIYAVLSYSITLTLDFWNFVAIFVLSAILLNYWIRFRYLNDYAQLKEPPLVKPDVNELHPDVNTAEPPPTFHNYLDDFLQAIRVFGFLEKPVFHELARHLQTRRLIAGDSMSLEQDKSFYCVIDGMVQVFAQTGTSAEARENLWDDEDMNGYQLLNEVGSGGMVSSLFTILSLFTEDVHISWQDDYPDGGPINQSQTAQPSPTQNLHPVNSDVSPFSLDGTPVLSQGFRRRSSTSSATSTIHPSENVTSPGVLLSPIFDSSTSVPSGSTSRSRPVRPTQVHRGVIARATEDTTLAVIPAEAFRRLTKQYPKATGHIVQVILTRFSRVTFNAAHKYLGLTGEVLRTEKAINDIACHPLPNSFYEGGGLQYLRHRFDGATSEASGAETDYFSYSSTSSVTAVSGSRELSATSLGKISDNPIPVKGPRSKRSTPSSRQSPRHTVQAGDLLVPRGHANGYYRPISRSYSILKTPRLPRLSGPIEEGKSSRSSPGEISSEDFDLREEVMSCIAKSIGLLQPPMSGSDSANVSPHLPPVDARQPPTSAAYNSPFSSLSLLDMGDDTSSMTGASSTLSNGDYMKGLDNEVEILYYPAGSTLVKAGEMNTGLFYVIEGFLEILLPEETKGSGVDNGKSPEFVDTDFPRAKGEKPRSKLLFTVKPGGIAGYLASLCSTASYVDIRAKTDTFVGFLPSHALERLLEKRPIVLLTLAKRLISLLSPLVLHIDASLDWVQVNAGQVLWRPEDTSDSFYIVINGRLRAIKESEKGDIHIVGEYGQGDTVGELDVITSSPRSTTVHAIRDTELIRMPQTLFNAISARNPRTTAQILRMIASRVRTEVDSSTTPGRSNSSEFGANNTNLKTVAVLPISRNIPIEVFARKLQAALEGTGASTSYLNQAIISSHLGRHAFTKIGKLKSAGWFADQEQRFRIVLYVADSPVNSSWTQTCIRQADFVMVVGLGDDPSVGEYERLLLSMKTTARKELVLLHPDRSITSGSTREWLKTRPWVHQHIHVELPDIIASIPKSSAPKDPDAVVALRSLKERVQSGIQKYTGVAITVRPQRLPHTDDFARLARRLCGKSVGLVLGGGGARGLAHLGLIRALEETGIPIDHVGGTSIGAFIGGLYAREGDLITSTARAKQFAGRMGNIWRMLSDVTYPIVAYTTGHEFNRTMYKAFYGLHIEDMWLPFFCNTTNIMTSRMEIHETGYAWRYIRASMTLVGLLPPLCDNGQLLVDGGYINNLPVQAMFSMGASTVLACDAGAIDDNSPRNFGDSVSGWWLLINRWNPFSAARQVPDITEIQSRLAYVSSVNTLEDAKVAKDCLYIQMPVQEYGTLQFGKFDEVQNKGYQAALDILEKFENEGKLPPGLLPGTQAKTRETKKGRSARRNSV